MDWVLNTALVVILVLAFVLWFFKARLDKARFQISEIERARHHAQDELARLSSQWNAVTENVAEGVILVDANARILFMNDAAKGFLNTPEGFGRDLNQLAHGWDFLPMVRDVLARRADALAQTLAKDERVLQARVRALVSESSRGAVIVLSELTELQRLGRIRRDFVANISHELRTPVTTLGLLTETLTNELPSDATTARDHLSKLRGQIDVLAQLSNEMMDLALIESGRMAIKLIEMNLLEVVNQVLDILRPQAERKQLVLDVRVPDGLRVLADETGVRKVLGNLIHNACKFTPPHGKISVSARREGDNVEIRVADTGVGIPAKDLPRIFERFYKVDRARSAGETRGTGLGLAIAKHVVEGHGGKIGVESVEGKGATFYFTLPAAG